MNKIELKKKGEQVAMAFALSGKKQGLLDQIKQFNSIIGENDARVKALQKELSAANAITQADIGTLSAELTAVAGELDVLLAGLKKEGYALPIGAKTSKSISM